MMDARLVWDTWRQILRDDSLVAIVTEAGPVDAATIAQLDNGEAAVLSDYASTPKATATNIRMYRRSLVRVAHVALGRLPLSQRLLFMSDLDVDEVASGFVRKHGHFDDGPNFWRLADSFVAHLATFPEFSAQAHQDVLAIDRALAALAMHLGAAPVAIWPDAAAAESGAFDVADCGELRFVATRAARVVASRCDLTPWIEDMHRFNPAEIVDTLPKHWLVYFPDADSAPAYAELSERSARMFEQLNAPQTALEAAQALGDMSEDAAITVICRLAELGVVVRQEVRMVDAQAAPASILDDDVYVQLDPAVEMLDEEVAEHRLLCHTHFGVGMAVPPGEGLSEFVLELAREPVRVGTVRRGFDDQHLVETMLTTLQQYGFLHVTSAAQPGAEALAHLRAQTAKERRTKLCHALELSLETSSANEIRSRVQAEAVAPELRLHGERLIDHEAVLAELAQMRQAGQLQLHRTLVRAADLTGTAGLVPALRGLCAEVVVDDIPWPAPLRAIAGLDVLVQAGVPAHAHMKPDISLLDPAICERARTWAASVFLTGLSVVLDAETLWPATSPGTADFLAAFEAVRALEDSFGDVAIGNMPSDEVLLGNAAMPAPTMLSDVGERLRLAYLRWRLPLMKSSEGDNTFSQTPEAEEKLVRVQDDLLPNHPELLNVRPGGILVDICGGNGRIARRLSPLVGRDGLVVSVEMLRCVSDRARRFAQERGFNNLQFRTGLAQRLPLPDGSADAAVNEWTGAIWQLGLGAAMLAEMARVVRVGGRIAVTHRLVRLPLTRLDQPWVQFGDIYSLMQAAFALPCLRTVSERVWGLNVQTLAGEKATAWRKHYLPRVVNPFDVTYTEDSDPSPQADVCLTIVAERV